MKSGQVWGIDLIVASFIFVISIAVLYSFVLNNPNFFVSPIEELYREGIIASELILSSEYPGILTNGKINQTKLDEFYLSDYPTKKSELGIKNEFYILIPELTINQTPRPYIGRMNQSAVNNLVIIERLSIYKNKPVKFILAIWN